MEWMTKHRYMYDGSHSIAQVWEDSRKLGCKNTLVRLKCGGCKKYCTALMKKTGMYSVCCGYPLIKETKFIK